jgi:hypothetical protein
VGSLKAAGALCYGAGKGAFLVAEELALEQAFGHGGAIQTDERARRSQALLVNQSRAEFLARAGLAIDEDRGIGGGDDAR